MLSKFLCPFPAVISKVGVFRFDNETGCMYLDTYHPGVAATEIRNLCQSDLDVFEVKGSTLPPTKNDLFLIHEVIDPEEIFIPR